MNLDIPTLFTNKKELLSYDFSFDKLIDSEFDESFFIDNLSIPDDKKYLCESYLKSIVSGYNHIYISKILEKIGYGSNICLPLIHNWEGKAKINNLVILSNPHDVERICKTHIKKAPIFTSFLHNSIISTTDNEEWNDQRQDMNLAFIPKLSLKKIFPISQQRAQTCVSLLKDKSENYTKSVDMSDFFLNETLAQLQLAMFGFSDTFQESTNKKLRNNY